MLICINGEEDEIVDRVKFQIVRLRNLRSTNQFVVIVLVGNDWRLIGDWSCY